MTLFEHNSKTLARISITGLMTVMLIGLVCLLITFNHTQKDYQWIYGLTIDDAWYDDVDKKDVIEGLKNLDRRPVVRIVMSRELSPDYYVDLFKSVSKYADIMACPVDSSEMYYFKDSESYLKRFEDSFEKLSQYVSIWEIGNEINGVEWIKQNPELIVKKVQCAADYIKLNAGEIAITMYCTDNPKEDMIDWARKYIPKELSNSADYCFISYYEDDNNGYDPNWKSVFSEIGKIFEKSLLGIGECGNTAEDATQNSKIKMAKKYYTMKKQHERFVGGYFWWSWVEDCIPYKDNNVYESINSYGRQIYKLWG